MKNILEI